MITAKEAAASLNGNQYGEEGSKELFSAMKQAGLVAVFGASDDLMEFRGAVHDEVGAWTGALAYFTKSGLLENKCEDDDCPHFAALRDAASCVAAIWAEEPEFAWTYKTEIPHETFVINEDGDGYSRGIVFALGDCK